MKTFGSRYKELRLANNLSLREFCLRFGIDASFLSKIERGVDFPPMDKLDFYLDCVGVRKDTEVWFEMYDLAYVARELPKKDILDNISTKMPVFFKSYNKSDGKQVSQFLKNQIIRAWTR